MKHTVNVTLLLCLIFLLSQIIGLAITNSYIDYNSTTAEELSVGEVQWKELPYEIERPEVEESSSFIYIIFALIFGTSLALIIIKYKHIGIMKFWLFFSFLFCLTIALNSIRNFVYIQPSLINMFSITVVLVSFLFAYIKVYRPGFSNFKFIIHNLTELFVYGGIAAIIVPIMNYFSVFLLMVLISVYDMIAVWKTKHMVVLAKFMENSKVFAGPFIPYHIPSKEECAVMKRIEKNAKVETSHNKEKLNAKEELSHMQKADLKTAELGGGDIAFPLIFTGVIMKHYGLLATLILPLFTTLALFLLLTFAKKDKYYPAMPYLSIGCLVGFGAVFLVGLI